MNGILYHGEPNGPSLTVLAAAFEKGVELTLERIDLVAGERHGARAPHAFEVEQSIEGEGPVLVVDGVAMADSVFVACYLDDTGDGPALRPADPYARWQAMAWCRYVIERIAPAASYLGLSAAPPAAVPAGIASQDLADRWREAVEGRFDAAKLDDSRAKIAQGVEKVEAQLADGRAWLMGDFGIADLESYSWLAGMPALHPDAFADRPRTAAWLDRVRTRPSVSRALALATVAEPSAVWAPGPEINRWG
ncbi:glutathione S-transferase family protein [Sphingomonas sp. SUN019]|uniref:glutathione S-transferase family protein n=1 Tax=Sphingomonas sp. SUN019 TaxID=2937788 RepID=UPI002164C10B|nr:glutathione S-transferase family protein [Sphingomonas sp. SUN019]UVO50637.1 glutathione S-transferase family protein [Sphingomonas sp. SUN019]